MSPQLMIRLAILAMILIAIAVFFIDRHRTHRCPQCESGKIIEVDRLTEEIKLNKREIPGIGSRLNVSATVSMRCHTCGHTWQKREIT
jgi:predicted Zn-ribbon and HTH transcriptional regulator